MKHKGYLLDIDDIRPDEHRCVTFEECIDVASEFDKAIFSVDENTGMPHSIGEAVLMDNNAKQSCFGRYGLSQMTGVGGVDSDTALDCIKSRDETLQQYTDRLHDIAIENNG